MSKFSLCVAYTLSLENCGGVEASSSSTRRKYVVDESKRDPDEHRLEAVLRARLDFDAGYG